MTKQPSDTTPVEVCIITKDHDIKGTVYVSKIAKSNLLFPNSLTQYSFLYKILFYSKIDTIFDSPMECLMQPQDLVRPLNKLWLATSISFPQSQRQIHFTPV